MKRYILPILLISFGILAQAQCACLGAVFNLPMNTLTIIEYALMIAMNGAMIVLKL
jgi:hypothetical protein